MPELPEVEITARLLHGALAGAEVAAARAPGLNVLKTFDPRLDALVGTRVERIGRRGKLFVLTFEAPSGAGGERLHLVIHPMASGRLQLYDGVAGLRDRTVRLVVNLADGRQLRLREFGTKQAAWARLVAGDAALAADERIAGLGPDAWPAPPADLADRLAAEGARPLYAVLRDQHVVAGLGRGYTDEVLWAARLSPYQRAGALTPEQVAALTQAMVDVLGGALAHYEQLPLRLPIPDKLPMPLRIHRAEGRPCPRCGDELRAVHFESYALAYCPAEQTAGRMLKDRRLSRLLK